MSSGKFHLMSFYVRLKKNDSVYDSLNWTLIPEKVMIGYFISALTSDCSLLSHDYSTHASKEFVLNVVCVQYIFGKFWVTTLYCTKLTKCSWH